MTANTLHRLRHKRGDTFAFATPLQILVDDTPVADVTGWAATCTINTASGQKIADAAVTLAPTLLTIEVPGGTWGWPVGPARFDVMFTDPAGRVAHTQTVEFEVVRSETTP